MDKELAANHSQPTATAPAPTTRDHGVPTSRGRHPRAPRPSGTPRAVTSKGATVSNGAKRGQKPSATTRGAATPAVCKTSGNENWYTPMWVIEAVRATMGDIDVDPASSKAANKNVDARLFYTKADDGLGKYWQGRVFLNPPYSRGVVDLFATKLLEKLKAGETREACVLVNNSADTRWFQALMGEAAAVCFLAGRLKFIDMQGNTPGTPPMGQAVLYFGPNVKAFRRAFAGRGHVFENRL